MAAAVRCRTVLLVKRSRLLATGAESDILLQLRCACRACANHACDDASRAERRAAGSRRNNRGRKSSARPRRAQRLAPKSAPTGPGDAGNSTRGAGDEASEGENGWRSHQSLTILITRPLAPQRLRRGGGGVPSRSAGSVCLVGTRRGRSHFRAFPSRRPGLRAGCVRVPLGRCRTDGQDRGRGPRAHRALRNVRSALLRPMRPGRLGTPSINSVCGLLRRL